jgi:hypothetical protein
MARVRSTARVSREGDETVAAETAPISEVMKWSGLVAAVEGTSNAEAEQTVDEGEDVVESEEDYNILIPTKPSSRFWKIYCDWRWHAYDDETGLFWRSWLMRTSLLYIQWMDR